MHGQLALDVAGVPDAFGLDQHQVHLLGGHRPGVLVELGSDTEAKLDVYDLLGRRVRNLAERTLPAGATVHVWDGRDASGRRLGSGVYFVRLSTPGGSASTRVLLP